MPRKSFVIRDGFKIQKQSILRICHIHVDVSGPRTIGRAMAIIGGNGCACAICCHWYHFKLCFRKAAEFLWEIFADFIQMRLVKAHDLLATSAVKRTVLADRFMEAIEILEAHLLSDHEHFFFDARNFTKPNLVDLFRRHARGRHIVYGLSIALISLWNRPYTGLFAAFWRVVVP